jgi:CBS-domain-containing membrane protein
MLYRCGLCKRYLATFWFAESLEMPVIEFMQRIRLAQDTRSGHRITKALVCAIPATATYAAALKKLASLHVHRLYVEDDEGRLVGVVSFKDIVVELMKHLKAA